MGSTGREFYLELLEVILAIENSPNTRAEGKAPDLGQRPGRNTKREA